MSVYTFDTLEQAENLRKYGFGEEQAKGLVQVIALSQTNLVTKQDLNQLRLELFSDMDGRLGLFDKKFADIDRRFSDIDKKFSDFDKNLIQLENRLENKIQGMTIRLASVMVLAIGTMTTLLKWVP